MSKLVPTGVERKDLKLFFIWPNNNGARTRFISLSTVGVCAHSHSAPFPTAHIVGEDAQPCLAHSPMALNDLNLVFAPLIVVQMKKYSISFLSISEGT